MSFQIKVPRPAADKKKSWKEILVDHIRDGKALPIVGNGFTDDLAFRNHQGLVAGWADYMDYPFIGEGHSLPQIAQYHSVSRAEEGQNVDERQLKRDYLTFLKEALFVLAAADPAIPESLQDELRDEAGALTVSQLAWRCNYPNLASPEASPLLMLAALPLPIYVTTSYHTFLEQALIKANKFPQSDFCRWHPGLEELPGALGRNPAYEPTPQQPLVYYLHGLDAYPESLVLTEDDHLDFLTHISRYHQQAIHGPVTTAITTCSLIMLGYSLRDWDFRVVFRGVIKPRPQSLRLTNVAIQLADTSLEKEFVRNYLRQANFEVEWSDTAAFIQTLYQRYEAG